MRNNESLLRFNQNLREVYEFFEARKQIPVILVNRKGEYVMN